MLYCSAHDESNAVSHEDVATDNTPEVINLASPVRPAADIIQDTATSGDHQVGHYSLFWFLY